MLFRSASWIADPITGGVQWSTNQAGASLAVGLGSSSVDLGDGDDNLSVSAWASGAESASMAIKDAVLTLGSGNDTAFISAYIANREGESVAGLALGNSAIDLGSGDDTITINGDLLSSKLDGGDGIDAAILVISSNAYKLAKNMADDQAFYTLFYDAYSLDIYSIEKLIVNGLSISLDDFQGSALRAVSQTEDISACYALTSASPLEAMV